MKIYCHSIQMEVISYKVTKSLKTTQLLQKMTIHITSTLKVAIRTKEVQLYKIR